MNRQKKSFSIAKFLKRALVVTVILAAIEIPVLYYYFSKNDNAEQSTEVANLQTATADENIIKEDANPNENVQPIVTETPPVVEQPSPSPIAQPPVVAKDTASKKSTTENTQVKPTDPLDKKEEKIVLKPAEKKIELTAEKMNEVVNQLMSQREAENLPMKCVKIRQTANSNVTNGFKIAEHLRRNGYIISGRETINATVKGIAVNAGADCMVITIGTL